MKNANPETALLLATCRDECEPDGHDGREVAGEAGTAVVGACLTLVGRFELGFELLDAVFAVAKL